MKTPQLLLAGLLLSSAAVTPLAAQEADATLYTRAEDGVLRAAIHIEIDFGAHLYHGPTKADLGHPEAVGQPTTIKFSGEGIQWGDVRFPEPHAFDQSEFGDGIFINGHEDEILVYAAGVLGEDATGDDVEVQLKGLVCNDRGCMPYRQLIDSSGEGEDEFFEDFPADLIPTPAPEGSVPTFEVPDADKLGGEADALLYTRVVDGKVQAALEIEIADGWHLYHKEKGHEEAIGLPTTVEIAGAGVSWGPTVWPEPHATDQSDIIEGAWIYSHEGTIVLYAEGSPADGTDATGEGVWAKIKGQTCDPESCIPYDETVVSDGEGPEDVWDAFPSELASAGGAAHGDEEDSAQDAVAGHSDDGGDSDEEEDSTPLGFLLLEAMGWGLITLLMPCTYPMIPITISFFTKQAEARGGNVLPLALAYGIGIVLVFVFIGVAVGPVIIAFATHPVTNIIIGALFLVFAFSLLGFFTLNPPKFLLSAAGKASMKGGYIGVFLMGTCLVVTSFTCTAPFVGTMLARAATASTAGAGASYFDSIVPVVAGMTVFGLTMAIPFVILSLVPGRISAMPRSGEWMNTLKVTLGFVELAAALKFVSNSDLGWGWNFISRELFLVSWALIFAAAGLYLLGKFFTKGMTPDVGMGRRISGVLFLAFAAYCGWGTFGNKMDPIMSAMNPPYSGGLLFPIWYEVGGEWEIVKDDHDRAKERASGEGKLVLINFTGFT